MACAADLASDSSRPPVFGDTYQYLRLTRRRDAARTHSLVKRKYMGEAMTKQHKGSKKAKKLAKTVKKEAKKEKKRTNTEGDRSDVKPPSPFSS